MKQTRAQHEIPGSEENRRMAFNDSDSFNFT